MSAPYIENPALLQKQIVSKIREEEVETITLGKRKFSLDRKLLFFDESNINDFLANFAAIYDEFGEAHALAQAEQDNIKHRYESLREKKFAEFKQGGDTEKLAAARAINEDEVQELHTRLVQSTYRSRRLAIWLRSLDDAHSSVKEFCYNLRKEMDKIYGSTIRSLESKMRD